MSQFGIQGQLVPGPSELFSYFFFFNVFGFHSLVKITLVRVPSSHAYQFLYIFTYMLSSRSLKIIISVYKHNILQELLKAKEIFLTSTCHLYYKLSYFLTTLFCSTLTIFCSVSIFSSHPGKPGHQMVCLNFYQASCPHDKCTHTKTFCLLAGCGGRQNILLLSLILHIISFSQNELMALPLE